MEMHVWEIPKCLNVRESAILTAERKEGLHSRRTIGKCPSKGGEPRGVEGG